MGNSQNSSATQYNGCIPGNSNRRVYGELRQLDKPPHKVPLHIVDTSSAKTARPTLGTRAIAHHHPSNAQSGANALLDP